MTGAGDRPRLGDPARSAAWGLASQQSSLADSDAGLLDGPGLGIAVIASPGKPR